MIEHFPSSSAPFSMQDLETGFCHLSDSKVQEIFILILMKDIEKLSITNVTVGLKLVRASSSKSYSDSSKIFT